MTTHITISQPTPYTASATGETCILDANVRISSGTAPGAFNDTMASDITFEVKGTLYAAGALSGIYSQSSNAHFVIDQSGIIIAGYGIYLTSATPADIDNAGYIGGTYDGIIVASESGQIVNSGAIVGTLYGIEFVTSTTRTNFSIDSNALIAGANAISMGAQHASITLGADSRVMATAYGILNNGTDMVLKNAGTIADSGGTAAYQGSAGVDSVTNTGEIVGDVNLGDGADKFRESGTGHVIGIVAGGLGDDSYFLSSNKMRISETNMEGTDTVRVSGSYSIADEGEVENLVLLGKAKINATGNEYANIVKGNAGINHIDGGLAADRLSGGKGDDLFVFTKGSSNDTITDYVDGHDHIRISGFDTFNAFKDLVITKQAGDVLIDFGSEMAGDSLLVEHAKLKDFDKSDFVFA